MRHLFFHIIFKSFSKFFFVLGLLCLYSVTSYAQDDEFYEDLLREEVEVENPVYKPVLGFGTGIITHFGDVKNNYNNPLIGRPSFKVNISTFIDNKHYFKGNFFLIYGNLTGNERSVTDLARNLNFSTDIIDFGINLNYDFRHFIKGNKLIRPFVSIGIENMQFNSKTDLRDGQGREYHYWPDGTIRNVPAGDPNSILLSRDFNYETDLREQDYYGLGNYNQNTFAIPLDAGFDFYAGNRVMLRLGTSLHYTFTDAIDNVSYKNKTGVIGDKKNDMFMFNYISLHLDLFSESKVKIVEKLFADVDFDYTMYGDEDLDRVYDGWDKCPETPRGVPVDTLGCPLDGDRDGVPDYKDLEKSTRFGAYVNDSGQELSDEDIIAMNNTSDAVKRDEVDLYVLKNLAHSTNRHNNIPIPNKFKSLDIDGDNYISFEEVLSAIDEFFDFESDLSTDDIYELNDFFFSQ